ncbi:MAG: dinuclear metal center YbgI/SA1388 family protein [Glaciecola sp.]
MHWSLFLKRHEFLTLIDKLLQANPISDYCPNGLQVEGSAEISKIITGVTASQALIDEAVDRKADCILVHHGYFWKGESQVITGLKQRRIKTLLDNNINLVAYHLPIDVHPTLGNNIQLGNLFSIGNIQAHPLLKPEGIVMYGELDKEVDANSFRQAISSLLDREAMHVSAPSNKLIRKVAWCTGGGQNYIDAAFELGVDAFISGEISEQTTHSARELDIHYYAAGHHATERYGVKSVGEYLQEVTGIECEFVDIFNPA